MTFRNGSATSASCGLLCVGVALLVSACGSSAPSVGPDASSPRPVSAPASAPALSVVTRLVDLTNVERTQLGLGTLHAEARLMQAAQIQADQLARVNQLDHILPEALYPRPEDRLAAAGYPWTTYAENLAYGPPDASGVVQAWMQSLGHRANILGANFTEIGTGYTMSPAGRPYYVQVFGRPR